MKNATVYLVENFDLRKRSKSCNTHGCNRLPTKEVVIFEVDAVSIRKRELVAIYFCLDHYRLNSRDLLHELNRMCIPGKFVDSRTSDILYVAP